MRLVYIYIDFTIGGRNPDGYRNYKKCGLNFGTEYYFNMSEPSEDKPNYELKCSARPAGERIEPGFWGNDRLYNISALVGDNGVGKTTLIHEIIRCLLGDSIKGNAGNSLFAIIIQDNNGEYYLQHSLSKPIRICMDFSNGVISDALCRLCDRCKQHSSNESKQDDGQLTHRLISETKLIYFSNTLTQSDKNLFETTNNLNPNGYPGNSQYILPLYNCSLTADIINAMRTSEVFDASIDNHLETYFNFRSYQEARYVFDRNQRKILLGLKKESGLPVPLPNSLTLMIPSVIGHLCSVIYGEDESRTILKDEFLSKYHRHFEYSSCSVALIAELCINCVFCFAAYVKEYTGRHFIPSNLPNIDFCNSDFYLKFLDSINLILSEFNDLNDFREINTEKSVKEKGTELYKRCKDYILLLWNNTEIINTFFQNIEKNIIHDVQYRVRCYIPLGEEIDKSLEEFMIRFINLTRAISVDHYFVLYNWGLSSGESNLLHMFTKLRYILTGNTYDKERYDAISASNTEPPPLAKRNELLVTNDKSCNSIILFIDEADLTFHPEWQRLFISILTEFLPKIFTDPYYEGSDSGCKDIQIILSTHSPLILGDFPSCCVTYLRKHPNGPNQIEDRSKVITFGENLYTILKDGFFLNEGAVGEFARRKITEVLVDTSSIREAEKNNDLKKWTDTDFSYKLSRLDDHETKTVQYLAHGIIQNKLKEEIRICRKILHRANKIELPETVKDTDYQARILQLEREKNILERRITALKRKLEASE